MSPQAKGKEANIHTKKSNSKDSAQWGNYQQSEMATYWTGEDIYKWHIARGE